MLELIYTGEEKKYKVEFDIVSKNIIKIIGDLPAKTNGFTLSQENENDNWDYTLYKTIYYKSDDYILFSNDGSVKPLSVVTFFDMEGKQIFREQNVGKYEELEIPKVQLEEGYSFVKWNPEIIESGEIKNDISFYPIVEDLNIYFHCSGGGVLEGETKQYVKDYSELVIPSPVADTNYKFVGWMPEIPSQGTINSDNRNFYAVFESTIPDRMNIVESDLTDAQMGLVENYDLATAASKEVTELQLALVELYNLISGGEI